MEGNIGADGKKAFTMGAQEQETNAGDHLMRATREAGQHAVGLGEVAGFAKDFAVEKNEGVSAENEGIGNFLGNDPGFAMGVEQANLVGRKVVGRQFGGGAGDDLKFGGELAQQIGTPGRRRSQNQ